jgi:hypothetical protein
VAARVHLPWSDLRGRSWTLRDALSRDAFDRAGDEIAESGLFVELDAWGTYLLAFD